MTPHKPSRRRWFSTWKSHSFQYSPCNSRTLLNYMGSLMAMLMYQGSYPIENSISPSINSCISRTSCVLLVNMSFATPCGLWCPSQIPRYFSYPLTTCFDEFARCHENYGVEVMTLSMSCITRHALRSSSVAGVRFHPMHLHWHRWMYSTVECMGLVSHNVCSSPVMCSTIHRVSCSASLPLSWMTQAW